MELDLEGKHAARAYAILVSLVVPRPIAWVTTVNAEGAVNAAPFSFFNVLGARPPVVVSGLPNITPIFSRIWLMKTSVVLDFDTMPVSFRSA